jgi:hypothetical protein
MAAEFQLLFIFFLITSHVSSTTCPTGRSKESLLTEKLYEKIGYSPSYIRLKCPQMLNIVKDSFFCNRNKFSADPSEKS